MIDNVVLNIVLKIGALVLSAILGGNIAISVDNKPLTEIKTIQKNR